MSLCGSFLSSVCHQQGTKETRLQLGHQMPLQAQGADEQIPPQGAGTEQQLQQGKGKSLGSLIFPPWVLRQGLSCAVGVAGSLDCGRNSFLLPLVSTGPHNSTFWGKSMACCPSVCVWVIFSCALSACPGGAAPWTAVPSLRAEVLERQDWKSAVWVVTLCCDQIPLTGISGLVPELFS